MGAMKMLLVALQLMVTAGTASADKWTRADAAVELTVFAALAVDYWQTRRIIDDPIKPSHRESNPVMGHGGDRVPPEIYFPAAALVHGAAAILLPQPYRRIAQIATLGVQARSIGINWGAGYRVEF